MAPAVVNHMEIGGIGRQTLHMDVVPIDHLEEAFYFLRPTVTIQQFPERL
jgi:hypothetical protein